MMVWDELADCRTGKVEIEDAENDGIGNRRCGLRRDVAVNVMAIVGSILWGGTTFYFRPFWVNERCY